MSIKKNNLFFLFYLILIIFLILAPSFSQAASWYDFMNKLMSNPGGIKPEDITTGIVGLTTLVLDFLLGIAVLFLIIGGYQYMTSVGRPDQIERAKNTITYSIVGIAVAGLAESITRFITQKTQGTANINDLITRLIDISLLFFGGIAVLVLVYGGIQYITAAGNPDQIGKAKNTIQYGIIGTIVIILSSAIAKFVENQFKGNPPLEGLITKITNTVIGITGILAVLFLIIGGYQYITAAGNPDQIGKAKNTIMYAIIGLVVVILSYAIVKFVTGIF